MSCLMRLTPGRYQAESLAAAMQPYCSPIEPDSLLLTLEMLLETVLAWIGVASWRENDTVIVHSPEHPPPQSAALIAHDGAFLIDLPDHPPLRSFARLLGWCAPVRRRITLDPDSFRAKVAKGT